MFLYNLRIIAKITPPKWFFLQSATTTQTKKKSPLFLFGKTFYPCFFFDMRGWGGGETLGGKGNVEATMRNQPFFGQSLTGYPTVEMKFDRVPPPPKIGLFVTFRPVQLSVFGRVFHFLDLPTSLKTAFRDIHHNY